MMDQQIRRREMAEKWHKAKAEGRTRLPPQEPKPLAGIIQPFASEEERQRHLLDIEHAIMGGSPF